MRCEVRIDTWSTGCQIRCSCAVEAFANIKAYQSTPCDRGNSKKGRATTSVALLQHWLESSLVLLHCSWSMYPNVRHCTDSRDLQRPCRKSNVWVASVHQKQFVCVERNMLPQVNRRCRTCGCFQPELTQLNHWTRMHQNAPSKSKDFCKDYTW